jgi:hypothetical protein
VARFIFGWSGFDASTQRAKTMDYVARNENNFLSALSGPLAAEAVAGRRSVGALGRSQAFKLRRTGLGQEPCKLSDRAAKAPDRSWPRRRPQPDVSRLQRSSRDLAERCSNRRPRPVRPIGAFRKSQSGSSLFVGRARRCDGDTKPVPAAGQKRRSWDKYGSCQNLTRRPAVGATFWNAWKPFASPL